MAKKQKAEVQEAPAVIEAAGAEPVEEPLLMDDAGRALEGPVVFDLNGVTERIERMVHRRWRELAHNGIVYEHVGDEAGARVYRKL